MTLHTVHIKGKGSPLLMLHGWGQTHKNLRPLAEHLHSISEPHLLDLPGFGKSSIPEKCWNAYDYADEIIRYLDKNHMETCSLLGHSFGGKVAMCTAIRYPERVSRLILLSPSGLLPKRKGYQKIRMRGIRLGGKLLKFYDKVVGSDTYSKIFIPCFASRDYKEAGNMRPILVRSVTEDLTTDIPKIQCPTLILWGEKDMETPLEMGYRLSRLIPNAELITFPHHGHQIFEDVGSHLCATMIHPFLQGVQ